MASTHARFSYYLVEVNGLECDRHSFMDIQMRYEGGHNSIFKPSLFSDDLASGISRHSVKLLIKAIRSKHLIIRHMYTYSYALQKLKSLILTYLS